MHVRANASDSWAPGNFGFLDIDYPNIDPNDQNHMTGLNSDFLGEQSKTLARRVMKEAGDDRAAQVKRGFRLALSREPTEKEIDRGVAFMDRLQKESNLSPQASLEQFSLLLLNLNEFVYLD